MRYERIGGSCMRKERRKEGGVEGGGKGRRGIRV